jgi:hypothetical protein
MKSKNQSILDVASRGEECAVYSPNQILNSEQLNKVTSYLAYQEHLGRVKLLGVGIFNGFQVSLTDDGVLVQNGVGVTTDGDILIQLADVTYTRFRLYDQTAPRYDKFFVGEEMRTVYELAVETEAGADWLPLAQLPAAVPLQNMTVVMLMESYLEDKNVCSGNQCDSLGRTLYEKQRLLLVDSQTADALQGQLATSISQTAQRLPQLTVTRAIISQAQNTQTAFENAYRDACEATLKRWHSQLDKLDAGTLPVPIDWLKKLSDKLADPQVIGVQYFYDFLKDIADTWNELHDLLLNDDALPAPDAGSFPKHLLLGDLKAPVTHRTGCYPSSVVASHRQDRRHAAFLCQKLNSLLTGYRSTVPADQPVRISPSFTENTSLENRAVPYYYVPDTFHSWNFRLVARNSEKTLSGYWLDRTFSLKPIAPEFDSQIGRHDFFRIEGHTNRKLEDAKGQIDSLIRQFNLPFIVRTILLHDDRNRLVDRPIIRYSDLHRLHQLIRKDLSTQLSDTAAFQEKLTKEIQDAEATTVNSQVPIKVKAADLDGLKGVVDNLPDATLPVKAATYTSYLNTLKTIDFPTAISRVASSAGSFKVAAGEVIRTDLTTPFDTININNHPAWLGWIDTLIQSKKDQDDDKLLFTNFVQQHPQLEHLGGVLRGGTFVLIYNESQLVVADCMLPYHWPEIAESEPKEPVLNDAPRRIPQFGIKFIPPVADRFDFVQQQTQVKLADLVVNPPRNWVDTVKDAAQADYMTLFERSSAVFSNLFNAKVNAVQLLRAPVTRDFSNQDLKIRMDPVSAQTAKINGIRASIIDPNTSAEDRQNQLTALIREEVALAQLVFNAEKFIVDQKIFATITDDATYANSVLAESLNCLQTPDGIGSMKSSFRKASGNQPQLLALANAYGF